MKHTRNLTTNTRLALALTATAALLGSACGSTTTSTPGDSGSVSVPGDNVEPAPATTQPSAPDTTAAPTSVAPPTTAPPAPEPEPAPTTTVVAEPEPEPPTPVPVPDPTDDLGLSSGEPEPEPEPEPNPSDFVEPGPVDPDPSPVGPSELVASADDDLSCGGFDPIPDDASIVSDLMIDLLADGTADDRLVTYFDGDWKLRSVLGGTIVSEVVVDDVGPGSVRVLGLADVGALRGGDEIIAVTGAGASAAKIGVFGHLEGGCLMQYRWADATPATFYVGGSITNGDSTFCGEGYIGVTGYEQDTDGTYFGWGSAFEEKSLGEFGYMLNSDDYSEGMVYEDLTPIQFDCFGLTL